MSSCPWCLEQIPFRWRKAPACPHCGRALQVSQDELVRPIDVRYPDVVLAVEAGLRRLLMPGLLVVLAGLLAAQFFAPLVVLVWLGHLVALRWLVVRDARRVLGKSRRFFTRWLVRLLFLTVGLTGYGLAATPMVGPIPGLATYLLLNWLVSRYVLWSLARERQRLPLALWEKAILGLLLVLVLVVFSCMGAGVYLVFWVWGKSAAFWHWLGFGG